MTRHPLDLPFEEDPQPAQVDIDGRVAAGLVVLATVAETALGPWPALVFRFSDGYGQFLPDVLLLLDDAKANDVPALVTSATNAAMRAARKANPAAER